MCKLWNKCRIRTRPHFRVAKFEDCLWTTLIESRKLSCADDAFKSCYLFLKISDSVNVKDDIGHAYVLCQVLKSQSEQYVNVQCKFVDVFGCLWMYQLGIDRGSCFDMDFISGSFILLQVWLYLSEKIAFTVWTSHSHNRYVRKTALGTCGHWTTLCVTNIVRTMFCFAIASHRWLMLSCQWQLATWCSCCPVCIRCIRSNEWILWRPWLVGPDWLFDVVWIGISDSIIWVQFGISVVTWMLVDWFKTHFCDDQTLADCPYCLWVGFF